MSGKVVNSGAAEKLSINQDMNLTEYFTNGDLAADLTKLEINGEHPETVNTGSQKIYYVLEGSIELTIDDDTHILEKGDAALIPPDEKHGFEGEAEILITMSPPYDPEDEKQG